MRLYQFEIEGFRRIKKAIINLGDATFLIGENNVGKSSVLKALEIFFSETDKLDEQDYFFNENPDYKENEITFISKFIDLPIEALSWKGFRGRVLKEKLEGKETLTLTYRKVFPKGGKMIRSMKCHDKSIKDKYSKCKTINDFIKEGIPENEFDDFDLDLNTTIGKAHKDKLELISELWEVNETSEDWQNNPGGIEGVISIKLPKYLFIPANDKREEIDGSSGTLQKTMKELFEEVRASSDNFKKAQEYLNLLAKELNPEDDQQEFGKMMVEVNKIVSDVFVDTRIHIQTDLNDPQTAIKPSFTIEMSSNVKTKPERQGLGVIRSAVFALLRYREQFIERKKKEGKANEILRTLIIGFEEPELYLHPNAAALMRDKIYELATSSHTKLVCTTHSPYMIDLGKKIDSNNYPTQVLNLFQLKKEKDSYPITSVYPFNITQAYKDLQNDDKNYVKFILKIDDYMAKVFFCKKVIIVEGDTEDIVLRETISRLPEQVRKEVLSNYAVVKARGKASIISLVKYFKAMGIYPYVIHDKDQIDHATKFNAPILEALGGVEDARCVLDNCIEDVLGSRIIENSKPYSAYKHVTETWGDDWASVQKPWKELIEKRILSEVFVGYNIDEK